MDEGVEQPTRWMVGGDCEHDADDPPWITRPVDTGKHRVSGSPSRRMRDRPPHPMAWDWSLHCEPWPEGRATAEHGLDGDVGVCSGWMLMSDRT
jgi:hypothetical protein